MRQGRVICEGRLEPVLGVFHSFSRGVVRGYVQVRDMGDEIGPNGRRSQLVLQAEKAFVRPQNLLRPQSIP